MNGISNGWSGCSKSTLSCEENIKKDDLSQLLNRLLNTLVMSVNDVDAV